MAGDIEPPELALLVDVAERARADDWTLRSAVVRYAQPEPVRASRILECVRRTEGALHPHGRTLHSEGPEIWSAFSSDGAASDSPHGQVVELLHVAADLDRLGDLLASWAAAWPAERPNADVDAITEAVEARLDDLGVPPEEPPPLRGADGPRRRRG